MTFISWGRSDCGGKQNAWFNSHDNEITKYHDTSANGSDYRGSNIPELTSFMLA